MKLRVINTIQLQSKIFSLSYRRFLLSGMVMLLAVVGRAQNVPVPVTDSLAQDSVEKATLEQAKQNAAAAGFTDTAKYNVERVDTTASALVNDTVDAVRDSIMAVKKAARHSPRKAALLSLVPGLGQAYNRKYWKIPIIYAGFGGLGYAIYYTSSNFYGYRKAYRAQVGEPPDKTASYKGIDDAPTLKSYRDYFKKNLDVSVIITAVWYLLNIVDATVDAHLFEWNMRNDLNVSWRPGVISNPAYTNAIGPGVTVRLGF